MKTQRTLLITIIALLTLAYSVMIYSICHPY